MSKIGKKPIQIPTGITIDIKMPVVKVSGPKGELSFALPKEIELRLNDKELLVIPVGKSKKTPALWGTARAIIANMVAGVEKGFEKKLEIEGVGFKAQMKDGEIMFNLGFSHPVIFKTPEGIKIAIEKNVIIVSGISLELVGQTAANIRALKKPEPYKGKGIRYAGEIIKRKAGKKVAGSAS
ncbi:MAG: 50S ribosomal protein L6 [Candidatus Azambacteria bacterium GW2011_GWE1_42_9]|nr:MAG: 50S ribosomal protein L6, chloroplastic [Candidatus Azambacteria bacterium GW2011_GWF1_41_10]KKS49520.1 MAG: 50S ribosomal protein L6, chloroplastic [Candidatus Azambacteria bacterium GW2011_GWF2_42_22]KKS69605.1 MAG: 50S ribosomal protein L6 [Candidatus Azambacteria bacterium GW2011_GWA2_42_62]KKS79517.1 MAG: 50S ribosomal protein L6 [Candidatus Azambacteria bacterium GW2011_GWE1_42_9]KKT03631.1 MAG: 50S ribosomal protein L6 [Candidatus Azambacteria bacterium GW2011_GWD1_43_18]KKT1278